MSEIKGIRKPSNPGDKLQGVRIVILLGLLLAGFGIRLIDLKDPPLDFHASRQLRSAIIARAYYYKFDHQADPELREMAIKLGTLEMYEPPILEAITGLTDLVLGNEYFWIGRIYNALFWCLGGAALFAIARRFFSFPASITGLCFYLFLPFGIIASRSFQPDPWMVMWIIVYIFTLLKWSEHSSSWLWTVLAGAAGAAGVLVKVFSIFFLGPIFLAIVIHTLGWKNLFKNIQVWVIGFLMAIPAGAYYLLSNPERSSDFFSFWVVSLSGLVLETNFYADWLAMIKGIMGLGTLTIALLGVLIAPRQLKFLLTAGWAGYLLFGLAFPYQYITHEYYHLPLIMLTSLSMIPILNALLNELRNQPLIWKIGGLGIFLFASFYGAYVARSSMVASSYELEPASWKRVGDALPMEKAFVALTSDYGMRLNYYGWRSAADYWPSSGDLRLFELSGNNPLDTLKRFEEMTAGMDYFLVTALSEYEAQPQLKEILTSNYKLAVEGNGFLIFDLNRQIKDETID